MAKPYREGDTWSVRSRSKKDTFYKPGFPTQQAAKAWLKERKEFMSLGVNGKPIGAGPTHTILARALSDYAQSQYPYLKGAVQELNRVNKYLRAANLPELMAVPCKTIVVEEDNTSSKGKSKKKPKTRYFEVMARTSKASIVNSLVKHRKMQQQQSEKSDALRAQLARLPVAEITRFQLQKLMNALQDDGYEAATVHLERALLRVFFNHAASVWNWSYPSVNPATELTMPTVDNQRNRVLSFDEQAKLEKAMETCTNKHFAPCVALLIETAMRQSEVLLAATWDDVDWDNQALRLRDAKAGSRDVPLSDGAIEILKSIPRNGNDNRILPITINAFRSCWNRCVQRAGLKDIVPHDLRHTGATRWAIRLNGNIFVLKIITGHLTQAQLERYVNLTNTDAVNAMNSSTPRIPSRLSQSPSPASTVIKRPVLYLVKSENQNAA